MRLAKLAIAFVLTFHAGLVPAQDDTAVADKKEKQEQETEKKPVEKTSPEVETPDSFEATEQLSEDIAADFPVDI